MENEKELLKKLYMELEQNLREFDMLKGGVNATKRKQNKSTQETLMLKARRLMEKNPCTYELLKNTKSYGFLDQDFFQNSYFSNDMQNFLIKFKNTHNIM